MQKERTADSVRRVPRPPLHNGGFSLRWDCSFYAAVVGADDHIRPRKDAGIMRADVVIGPYKCVYERHDK